MKYNCLILFIFLLFVACNNVTFSPLVGKWQLKTVEKNGNLTPVDSVWYNFQSISLFSIQIYVSQQDTIMHFFGVRVEESKELSIRMFCNDEEFMDMISLSDWTNKNRSFSIIHLNRRRLLLQSEEGYLYSFIKF